MIRAALRRPRTSASSPSSAKTPPTAALASSSWSSTVWRPRGPTIRSDLELNLNTGADTPLQADHDVSRWPAIGSRSIRRVRPGRDRPPRPFRAGGFTPIRRAVARSLDDSVRWHRPAGGEPSDSVLNACRALRFATTDAGRRSPKRAGGRSSASRRRRTSWRPPCRADSVRRAFDPSGGGQGSWRRGVAVAVSGWRAAELVLTWSVQIRLGVSRRARALQVVGAVLHEPRDAAGDDQLGDADHRPARPRARARTSLLQLVWVILAYMIASTVLVLRRGRLSDLFGRKQRLRRRLRRLRARLARRRLPGQRHRADPVADRAGRRRRRSCSRTPRRWSPTRSRRSSSGSRWAPTRWWPRSASCSARCSAARWWRSRGTGCSGSTSRSPWSGAVGSLVLRELAKRDTVRGLDLLGTLTFVAGLTGLVYGVSRGGL